MFRTHTSNLPPEQRQRIHPQFLANEESYLQMRNNLVAQHRGQWVAVQDGQVVAAGNDLVAVAEAAVAAGGHPYVVKVGDEDTLAFRVRRAEFLYDSSYQPFALPRAEVTFWNHAETHHQVFGDVIPDTGADLSVLPDADCTAINLFGSPYMTGFSRGVVGAGVTTLIYYGKAEVNGRRKPTFVQPIPGGRERIIGRDVMNYHRVVFDGPGSRVVFEP